jgi:selenocysteine-specific translation elongation factor
MDTARKITIAKNVIQQLEDAAEAVAFEGKIATRIGDNKGIEAVKKRLAELTKQIEAANQIIAEIADGEKPSE